MKDSIIITSNIQEWTVFQHHNGMAKVYLSGEFSLGDEENYPVLRITDTITQKIIYYDRVLTNDNNLWHASVLLPVGCYRLETGISLKIANFDSRFIGKGHIINNIFVGEVFVIAGQSNAVGYAFNDTDIILDTPQYGVSCLKKDWQMACHPLGYTDEDCVNSDILNSGHSPWIKLGSMIFNKQSMPVGLIPTALNGSSIDQWERKMPLFENMISKAKLTKSKHLIWYQGCSDVYKYQDYAKKLSSFLQAVKEELGDITIYLVQISGVKNSKDPDIGWRMVREIQQSVAKQQKTIIIPTYDLSNYSDDIHLGCQDNLTLAKRVFDCYQDPKPYNGVNIHITGQNIKLHFGADVSISQKSTNSIALFDIDNNILPTNATAYNNIITITSPDLRKAHFVGLSFGSLYDGNALLTVNNEVLPYFYFALDKKGNN